ncbi:hypothetical protein BR93DRAFT_490804 [Coniochaeta sp. PMI_546]|nr:hypothetical protein BR93DRAFT_490804 [Coniochaeta sp. PMI_546]
MRPSIALLIASSGLANASWVNLPGHRNLVGRGSFPPPRETGRVACDGTKGWTPKPTPAPGSVSESDAVLELLKEKRAAKSSNTWEDDITCGWTSGVSCKSLSSLAAPLILPRLSQSRRTELPLLTCYSPAIHMCTGIFVPNEQRERRWLRFRDLLAILHRLPRHAGLRAGRVRQYRAANRVLVSLSSSPALAISRVFPI